MFFDRLRVACRMLARRPGLTLARLATVTLLVTGVTAVFTVANALWWRALPFPDDTRVVEVALLDSDTTAAKNGRSLQPLTFVKLRERQHALASLEGIWVDTWGIGGRGEPESVRVGRISAGFIDMFGGHVALGRTLLPSDVDGNTHVVVLSDGLWQRRFGRDPAIVGQEIHLEREPYTVVGILRPGFEPAFTGSELWVPLSLQNGVDKLALSSVATYGRLLPGTTIAAAQSALATTFVAVREEAPVLLKGDRVGLVSVRESLFSAQRGAILLVFGAVLGLAVVAVSNLANLSLADIAFRRKDFAVREALGGSRLAIAEPELMQCLLLAVFATFVGVAVALVAVPWIIRIDPSLSLAASQIAADWRAAVGGALTALAVMALSVALPAVRLASRGIAVDVAAGATRAVGRRGDRLLRHSLVAVQTAVALVVLSAGSRVVVGFERATHAHLGFDPQRVLTAQLTLSATALPSPVDRSLFVERVLERLHDTPGVVAAGTTLNPFRPGNAFSTYVLVEDRPSKDGRPISVQFRRISPGYLATLHIALLRGRDLSRRDWADAPPVALVSRSFAERYWPGGDPIGRRIQRGPANAPWATIVGVVDDVRDQGLEKAPADTIYTPYYQGSSAATPVGLVVRTAGDPTAFVAAIKQAVWEVDPVQPLANVITLESFLADTLGPQRLRALLVAACSAVALLLAIVGIYSVTARAVAERTREVGVRMALGAKPREVWLTVAGSSLCSVAVGTVFGSVLAGAAGLILAALLPELRDVPWTVGAGSAPILACCGALAAGLGARAASKLDPLRALRS